MARPRPTPLDEGSIQNMEREEIRFKSSVPVLTETDEKRRGEWGEQQGSLCSRCVNQNRQLVRSWLM